MKKPKTKNKNFRSPPSAENLNFSFLIFHFNFRKEGITLLLVIFVLTALLSISIGIFNVVFTELRISGEITDSFIALAAADEAVERAFYLDRQQVPPLCSISLGVNCFVESRTVSSGACYVLRVDKTFVNASTNNVTIKATGEYRCGAGILSVKRALSVSYNQVHE